MTLLLDIPRLANMGLTAPQIAEALGLSVAEVDRQLAELGGERTQSFVQIATTTATPLLNCAVACLCEARIASSTVAIKLS
jgi:DNA-binding transcriptional regulator LsrR (DeoR family)